MANKTTALMKIVRNLSLVTTLLVALLAVYVGHRRSLYSQTCSLELDQVVLLTRDDFPLLFAKQKQYEQQQQQQQGAADIPIRIHPCHVFSQDYFQARTAFRKVVQDLKDVQQQQRAQYASEYPAQAEKENYTPIELYTLPVVPEMDYTMDIVVLPGGTTTTSRNQQGGGGGSSGLVLHSSGVHGVEGYAGSAIQLAFLKALLAQEKLNARTSVISLSLSLNLPTIVLIHAVNPFGMARFRRANENNVDLNRNGIRPDDWSRLETSHDNHENYALFDKTLFNMLDQPPNGMLFFYKAIKAVMQHGIPRIKAAMVAGQYYQPRGIFYGGSRAVEPSIRILQEWLQNEFLAKRTASQNVTGGEAITWVDVHTGLGKFGHDTLMFNNFDSSSEMAQQVVQWFPDSGNTMSQQKSISTTEKAPTTSPSSAKGDDDDENTKDVIQGYDQALGFLANYLTETVFGPSSNEEKGKLGQSNNTLIMVQEFGTLHSVLVGHALMTENSAHDFYDRQHNQPDVALEWAKSTTGRVFYPQNREWRQQVLTRGLRVLHQAIQRSKQQAV